MDGSMRPINADELAPLVKRLIDMMTTVDPVKHGRWIYYEGETIEDGGRCSVCECDQPLFIEDWEWKHVETDYCPNCGAKMDEEE